MATILKFEPRRLEQGYIGSGAAGVTLPGEVVIFPGVRIQRGDFRLSDRLTSPDGNNPGLGRRTGRTTRK